MLILFVIGAVVIYLSYRWTKRLYDREMDEVSNLLPRNYRQINAEILDHHLGTISRGKYTYYAPYFRYKYYFQGEMYENDRFSSPKELEYRSSIDVTRIMNKHKGNFRVYVNIDDPKISFVRIDEEEVHAMIMNTLEKYILAFISMLVFIFLIPLLVISSL